MSGGFGFPVGCAAAVAAVILADLAGATVYPWYALVTLGAVVLATGYRTSFSAAAGVAVVAWALHDGFVLGRAGALAFSPASAAAALVLTTALAAGVVAKAVTRTPVRIPAPRRPAPTLPVREPTLQVRESSV
ncbi:hypothetical protein ACIA5G_46890 [Amycolatopsis sp. NPDC051758]|uniref:hypothetical protein n=1 Tax=Amycolatopsis sp. NPDC051758 TaxID=3363935 RepID=UPI0037B6760C